MATDEIEAKEWFTERHKKHIFCIYIKPKLPAHEWDEMKNTIDENLKNLAGRQRYVIADTQDLSKQVCNYVRNIRRQ